MTKQEIINVLKNKTCDTCIHRDIGKICRKTHQVPPASNTCDEWWNWGDWKDFQGTNPCGEVELA